MPKEQWSSIRFWRYVKASPREDARVLLRLAPGNDPVLVERPVGRGKVLLFTSSANRDWTDMMVNPAYLMMVQQMVTYLTRKPYEAPVAVADELVFELPSESIERVITVQDPQGDDIPLRVVESDGLKTAALPNAELPGVYTALSSSNGARAKPAAADRLPEQRVAVNVDTQESAIAVLRDDTLSTVARSLSTWLIGEKQDIRSAVTESRQGRELWRALLLTALIALIAESILARVFTRRTTGTTEVYARRATEL